MSLVYIHTYVHFYVRSYKQLPNSYVCSLTWTEALAQGISMNVEHFGMHNLMAQMTIVVKIIEIFYCDAICYYAFNYCLRILKIV